MNQDFVDLLRAFAAHDVRFLVVGACALAVHGHRCAHRVTGLTFTDAWPSRLRAPFGPLEVDYLGRDEFIRNKQQLGRPKDLGDIAHLL